jgi:NAD(P)-dependent dehydrogenase (short-subunit alcohol dehydrogenase family)
MANETKVALVTGSNRGIGFETARQLGQQGVTVIVSAHTEQEAADAASKLRSEGIEAEALALECDQGSRSRCRGKIRRVTLRQAGHSG